MMQVNPVIARKKLKSNDTDHSSVHLEKGIIYTNPVNYYSETHQKNLQETLSYLVSHEWSINEAVIQLCCDFLFHYNGSIKSTALQLIKKLSNHSSLLMEISLPVSSFLLESIFKSGSTTNSTTAITKSRKIYSRHHSGRNTESVRIPRRPKVSDMTAIFQIMYSTARSSIHFPNSWFTLAKPFFEASYHENTNEAQLRTLQNYSDMFLLIVMELLCRTTSQQHQLLESAFVDLRANLVSLDSNRTVLPCFPVSYQMIFINYLLEEMSLFSASCTFLPLLVQPLLFYEKLLPTSDQQKSQLTLMEKCLRLTIFTLSSFHGLCNFNDQMKNMLKTWFSSWADHSSDSQDQLLDFIFALFPHYPYFHCTDQDNVLELAEKQLMTRLRGSELRNSRETSKKTPKWNVTGQYLPGEGLRLLPLDTEPAVENIRLSFLIATLVDCHLFEALFTCLTKGDFLIKRKSAFLLGFLVHDVHRLFSKEHSVSQRIEGLQTRVLDVKQSEARLVTSVVYRVDSLKKKLPPNICKIFANPKLGSKNSIFDLASPFFGILSLLKQNSSEEEINIPAWVIESLTSENLFNWDLLALVAHSWIVDAGKPLLNLETLNRLAVFCFDLQPPEEEKPRKNLPRKSCLQIEDSKSIVHDCNALPWRDSTWADANKAGWVVYGLVRHLTSFPKESSEAILFDRIVERLNDLISSNEQFLRSLRCSCAPLLILAVGALTASSEAEARTPSNLKNLLFKKMLQLPLKMDDLLFVKVLIASCDYRRADAISRQFFTAAVSCSFAHSAATHEALAIFCLLMVQLLFRMQVDFVSNWAVEPVLRLIGHPSQRVASRALSILYEISFDSVNIHALDFIFTDSKTAWTPFLTQILVTPLLEPVNCSTPKLLLQGHLILANTITKSLAIFNSLDIQDNSHLPNPLEWLVLFWLRHGNHLFAVNFEREFIKTGSERLRAISCKNEQFYSTPTSHSGIPRIELDRLEQTPQLQDLDVSYLHSSDKSPKDLLLRKLQSACLDLMPELRLLAEQHCKMGSHWQEEEFEDFLTLQESLEVESVVIHEQADEESDYTSSIARIVPLRSLDWSRRIPLVHLFALLSSHDLATFQLLQRNHSADLISLISDLWYFVKQQNESDQIKSNSLAIAGLLQGVHGLNWWRDNVDKLPDDLPFKMDPIACFADLMSRIITSNSFSPSVKVLAWICVDQLFQKQPQPLRPGAWTASAAGKPVLPFHFDSLLVQSVEDSKVPEKKDTGFLSDPKECLWRKCRDSQEATHLRLFTTTGPECAKRWQSEFMRQVQATLGVVGASGCHGRMASLVSSFRQRQQNCEDSEQRLLNAQTISCCFLSEIHAHFDQYSYPLETRHAILRHLDVLIYNPQLSSILYEIHDDFCASFQQLH